MSESKKIIVDLAANLGMDREVAHILPLSLASEVREHMPWFSAHPEYDAGYNAGIAAAAVHLKRRAEIWGGHFPSEQRALTQEAETLLTLMRVLR